MNIALKEWTAVVSAMRQGAHHVLLRKGGLADKNQIFTVEHNEFLLFPTLEHQNEKMISERYRDLLNNSAIQAELNEKVTIECWAKVQEMFYINELNSLTKLKSLFIWSDEYLQMRLNYKPEKPLVLLFLRVYSLLKPAVIPNLNRYRGCRSWVRLEEELETSHLRPIIDDSSFKKAYDLIVKIFK